MRSLVHSCPGGETVWEARWAVKLLVKLRLICCVIWAKWCLALSDTLSVSSLTHMQSWQKKSVWIVCVIILQHYCLLERATQGCGAYIGNLLPANVATFHATVYNQYALHSKAINEANLGYRMPCLSLLMRGCDGLGDTVGCVICLCVMILACRDTVGAKSVAEST